MRYRIYSTVAAAQDQADALWQRYLALECAARGLPPGSSLDTRAGQIVEPPITVRYVEVVEVQGDARGALRIDDFALAQQGQTVRIGERGNATIDVEGHVDETDLPENFRTRVRPEGQAGVGPRAEGRS